MSAAVEIAPEASGKRAVLQTPGQAIRSKYTRSHLLWSVVINWGLNTAIPYAVEHTKDCMGLWTKPNSPEPSSTPLWGSLAITLFFCVFLSSLVMTCSARRNVAKAKLIPVAEEAYTRGWLLLTPCRIENSFIRAVALSLYFEVIYLLPTLLVMGGMCARGEMNLPHNLGCGMEARVYPWFVGLWSVLLAAISYPLILLGAANRARIPDEVYDTFLAKLQEQQLDKQEQDKQQQNGNGHQNGHQNGQNGYSGLPQDKSTEPLVG